jgi:hypothetical protein
MVYEGVYILIVIAMDYQTGAFVADQNMLVLICYR